MYRIHFGYGSRARLTAPGGEDTTIVYGMLDVIIRLMEIQPPPTHFAMVVDMAAKTWRYPPCPRGPSHLPSLRSVPDLRNNGALSPAAALTQRKAAASCPQSVVGCVLALR